MKSCMTQATCNKRSFKKKEQAARCQAMCEPSIHSTAVLNIRQPLELQGELTQQYMAKASSSTSELLNNTHTCTVAANPTGEHQCLIQQSWPTNMTTNQGASSHQTYHLQLPHADPSPVVWSLQFTAAAVPTANCILPYALQLYTCKGCRPHAS